MQRKHRFKPGTIALREIRRLQRSTHLLIPRAPFQRVVRDICSQIDSDLRFQSQAILALQESSEAFVTSLLEDANLCCLHARRVTLMKRDMDLARRIRGDSILEGMDRASLLPNKNPHGLRGSMSSG